MSPPQSAYSYFFSFFLLCVGYHVPYATELLLQCFFGIVRLIFCFNDNQRGLPCTKALGDTVQEGKRSTLTV